MIIFFAFDGVVNVDNVDARIYMGSPQVYLPKTIAGVRDA
jgi:hypothetical protein